MHTLYYTNGSFVRKCKAFSISYILKAMVHPQGPLFEDTRSNGRSLYETHTYFLCPFFFLAKIKDSYYYFFSNSSKAQIQTVTCQIPHFCYNTDCFNMLAIRKWGCTWSVSNPSHPTIYGSSSVSICCHKKWYYRSWAGTHGAIASLPYPPLSKISKFGK